MPEPLLHDLRVNAGLQRQGGVRVAEIMQAIRRLGELRDQGLISEAEFAAKKAELLDRM